MTAHEFEQQLLDFIREMCRKNGIRAEITPDTLLFADRLLNSMRIIDLMAFVEEELGIVIPDAKLSMQYFRTPRTIAATFCWPEEVQDVRTCH